LEVHPLAYRGFRPFTLIYARKKRPWIFYGSKFNEKRPSVRQRSLMPDNGQRSPLRPFTVSHTRLVELSQTILG
jgi:hypothetical protein